MCVRHPRKGRRRQKRAVRYCTPFASRAKGECEKGCGRLRCADLARPSPGLDVPVKILLLAADVFVISQISPIWPPRRPSPAPSASPPLCLLCEVLAEPSHYWPGRRPALPKMPAMRHVRAIREGRPPWRPGSARTSCVKTHSHLPRGMP